MGKNSNKNHNRTVFVCIQCAHLAGKEESDFRNGGQLYSSTCDICRRRKIVTHIEDWNTLAAKEIAAAKQALREFGLDKKTFADSADIKKFISIMEEVLGDNKSDLTKQMLSFIIEKIGNGKPVESYDAKTLTYCYAQDVTRLKEHENQD